MKISIIGAGGYVGSNVAFLLALQGLSEEIVLIDPYKANIVAQFAMDAGTAVADKEVSLRPGDYPDMRDSGIVIVCAGAAQGLIASRMEMLPQNLPIIRDIAEKLKKYCPDAVVVTATNPVDPLNYAMYLATGFDRHRIIGYSMNDSIRFRVMAARALGQAVRDVECLVIGEHGESQVLLFSTVRVKKKPVKFDDSVKQKVRAQVPDILRGYEELRTGRTAGITSAVGLKEIVGAIVNNTKQTIPSSAVLDGEYGCRGLSMGVPLELGSGGIQKILEKDLAPDEKAFLATALETLKPAMRRVEEYLGISRQG